MDWTVLGSVFPCLSVTLCGFDIILYSTAFPCLESQSPPSRHIFSWVRIRLSRASSLTVSSISLLLSLKLILQRFRYSSITSCSSQTLCSRSKFKDVPQCFGSNSLQTDSYRKHSVSLCEVLQPFSVIFY